MATIHFQVYLIPEPQTLLQAEDQGTFNRCKTFLLPTSIGSNRVLKHGDIITLSGQEAIYMRNLIRQGLAFLREVPRASLIGHQSFSDGFDEGYE